MMEWCQNRNLLKKTQSQVGGKQKILQSMLKLWHKHKSLQPITLKIGDQRQAIKWAHLQNER